MLGQPFQKAAPIFHTLNENGYECYFVGGSVRDHQLRTEIGDVDLATNADPTTVQQLFSRTVPVGVEHGTVLVLLNDESYEVTTYRTEGEYKDHRRPEEVHFVHRIEEDLSRRDFTINAMAMDLQGQLIDPFDGKIDLENQLIRTVGDPFDRFNEDALRMLRAIRFSSQLNFSVADEVIEAIRQNRHLLLQISNERISVELTKMFRGKGIKQALAYMNATKLYECLPVFHAHPHIFKRLIDRLNSPITEESVIVAFLHHLEPGISIAEWVRAYKLSNTVKQTAKLIEQNYQTYINEGITPLMLYELSEENLLQWVELVRLVKGDTLMLEDLKTSYRRLPIKRLSDLAVNGSDLISWFPERKKGKWISEYLEKLRDKVLNGELPNKKDILEGQVKQWNQTEQN